MKVDYVCKPVFYEHTLPVPVEATYIHVTKLGRKEPNPYFSVTTWPNQMGSSMNSRKIVIVS